MTIPIASPIQLKSGLQLPNRLVKAAMTERLASETNLPTERHVRLYRAWADGGIGLQITGNVIIDRRNLEAPGNVVIDAPLSGDELAPFVEWAKAAKARGGKVVMQLSHAGRQTMKNVNPSPDAPSAIAVNLPGGQFGVPQEMSLEKIERVADGFAIAAQVAQSAGFDGVQIHAAHGYLISQFLSPLSNRRSDKWGGSLENRARLLLECVARVKAATASRFVVSVKLNSTDFQKGGFSRADSMAVISMLNELDLDFVELSGGNYEQPKMMDMEGLEPVEEDQRRDSTKLREAYFLEYAKDVRALASMPIMVTGGFRSLAGMNEALDEGDADLIGLARPLCVDTDGPDQLLAETISELPRWEKELRLGPGIFGPNSRIGIFKAINGFGAQAWYYSQLRAISEGRPVNRKLGLLKALIQMQSSDNAMAKKYHAALRKAE